MQFLREHILNFELNYRSKSSQQSISLISETETSMWEYMQCNNHEFPINPIKISKSTQKTAQAALKRQQASLIKPQSASPT